MGRWCIDARICENGLLNTFKKLLSDIIDFEYTSETSNVTSVGFNKEYGLEQHLANYIRPNRLPNEQQRGYRRI